MTGAFIVTEIGNAKTLQDVTDPDHLDGTIVTANEFRQLLIEKWGKSYDVQLRRRGDRVLVLVMWKYLEQQSFPLSEADYLDQLESILVHLREWGAVERVQQEIWSTRQKPRIGQAVTIPIHLSELGERASEWIL